MTRKTPDSAQTCQFLERIGQGDADAMELLLARHRPALREFVDTHLDRRIRARVDPSDVVQDAQMEIVRRMDEFLATRPMPFRLWLRKKAYDRLLNLRREHLTSGRRSVGREVPQLDRSSLLLARPMLAKGLSPSQMMERRELVERVSRAVARLSVADREILLLRHAEDLPFDEIACLLEVAPAAARKRFGRALIRLQKVLVDEGLLGASQ